MARGRKPTTAVTIDARINDVLRMLVEGWSLAEVYQYSLGEPETDESPARRPWGVTVRQVKYYAAKARVILARDAKASRQVEFGKATRRLGDLYRVTRAEGDHAGALAVEREHIRLYGLAEPEKRQVDVTSGGQPLRTEIVLLPREPDATEESNHAKPT